jgi:hypothetical protein
LKPARHSLVELKTRAKLADKRLRALWCIPDGDSDLWECGVVLSEDREGATDVTMALLRYSRANCQREAEAVGLSLVLLPGGQLEVARQGHPLLKIALNPTEQAVVSGALTGETIADTARAIGRHKQTLYMYRDRFARRVRGWSLIPCSRCGARGAHRISRSGAFLCDRWECSDWHQPSQPAEVAGARQ